MSVVAEIEAAIEDALLARLSTLPAQTPPVNIIWPDDGYEPTPDSFYLEPTILPNTNVNRGVSNASSTEFRGILQVSIMAPQGANLIALKRIAGNVADHFERGAPIVAAGTIIKIDGRPSIAPHLREPARIRMPVSIRYHAFA